jgi:multicomponent Na+:H+ antiporter subunit F
MILGAELTLLNLVIVYVVLPLIMIAILLGTWRVVVGKSTSDRVVALDFITTLGIAICAVYVIYRNTYLWIDIATAIALLSFLGTVGFAYYLERK